MCFCCDHCRLRENHTLLASIFVSFLAGQIIFLRCDVAGRSLIQSESELVKAEI